MKESSETHISESSDSFEIDCEDHDQNSDDTKEELLCEQVDMNDPKMDPLEWGVRRVVSIPKQYYWVSKKYDVSVRTKVWHRTVATLGVSLRMAERVGEVIANAMGLNASRFEYVTDFMTDDELETARQNAEESRVRRENRKRMAESSRNQIQVV